MASDKTRDTISWQKNNIYDESVTEYSSKYIG